MKKKSRFLTGLLSAVMALSLCALPASAADDAVANTDVWGDTSASITIHKYEYNRPESEKGTPAPGTTLDAKEIPKGAKALAGVTFTIYKVQDRNTLAEYYSGKNLTEDKFKTFTDVNKYYKPSDDGTFTVEDGNGNSVTGIVGQKTNDKGETTFSIASSDLGLYLVVETDAPDKVKTKQIPFLVSVPMKNPKDQVNWLYNINVYPKNATQYGGVTVKKVGITGSDAEVTLSDVTFKLYKDVKDVWTEVTTRDDDATKLNLTTTGDGTITISGLSKGKYKLIEQESKGNKGYIISEKPITFTISEDGELVETNMTKDAANNIVVKNYRPDLDKKVYNDAVTENNGYVEGSDYSVGDMVPYQITVKVPQNITELATFTVTDTPAGLEDQKNTIAIAVKDETDKPLTKNTEYKVEDTTLAGGFSITFDTSEMKNYAGKTLVITYKAKLLDSAVKTTDGNKNSAKLTYTNKIKEDGTPYDNSKNTITDETVVYTFAIRIKKTDGVNAKLSGAKFDLYKEVTADTETAITADDAKEFGLDSAKTWLKVESDLTSGEDGLVTTNKGLANGTYYLVETQAPADYNLLAKPVEVKLDIAYKYTWAESKRYDTDGNLFKHETSAKEEKFDKAEDENDKNAKVIGTQKGTDVGATGTEAKGTEITVINRKGFDLPVTGGFGTLLFSAIGALLVVGGVGVLMSTKKKKGNG